MCLEHFPFRFATKKSLEKVESAFRRGFEKWQGEWVVDSRAEGDSVKGCIEHAIPNYPFLEVKLEKGYVWLVFDENTELEILLDLLGNDPGIQEDSLENPIIAKLIRNSIRSLVTSILGELGQESNNELELKRTRGFRFHMTSHGETLSKLGCYRLKTRGYCFYLTSGLVNKESEATSSKPLMSFSDAVKDHHIDLDVVIPGIGLTFDEFNKLSPGQVLISDTRSDGSVQVSRQGKFVSAAKLHTQGERKSVEIIGHQL